MILNKFTGIEVIRLHFIKYPFEKVEQELGGIIMIVLNNKWKKISKT